MPWVVPRDPPSGAGDGDGVSADHPHRGAAGVAASWRLGGHEVWGKTGGRWGYNAGTGGTRDLSRTLVHSVNATDAKGQGTNDVVVGLIVSAFGAPARE